MSDDVPLFGFDPTEVGPFDVIGAQWARAKARFWEHARVIIPGLVVLVVAGWYFGVSVPRIPDVLVVTGLVALLSSGTFWLISRRVAGWLHTPDGVLLSEQDPVSGEQWVHRLAPDTFAELSVENVNGKPREKEFLATVSINGVDAYEVHDYDPEENHAVASWMASMTGNDIRQMRKTMARIVTSLEEDADRALAMKSNQPQLVREQTADVVNDMVAAFEGVELPHGGKGYFEELEEELDEDVGTFAEAASINAESNGDDDGDGSAADPSASGEAAAEGVPGDD